MPRIFDNIEQDLLPALQQTLNLSNRADICVGYFNLRGWKYLQDYVERWPGGESCCRLLIGMQRLPHDVLREGLSLVVGKGAVDQQEAMREKNRLIEELRDQLAFGAPTNDAEAALRRLAAQIRAKKVVIKLFLKHPLHAKLYLLFRVDPNNPITGYLGSSNLTLSGLRNQGELNIDVLDHDAANKLAKWFNDRWTDRLSYDASEDIAKLIEESWARDQLVPPYHVYLKMAFHLSQEARAGISEFRIPREFGNKLFEFQVAAVKIAAHHLNKRGGVLIGDVVGLGKTLMATALAKVFEEDQYLETLILCPKNLVPMWEAYTEEYRLHAKVISTSRVIQELPNLRRYRIVLIDESHNLRNREGKRYRAIQEYIQQNDSRCILLSATPYNKTYLDLSNQLRLFISETKDIGIRPERLLKELTESEFIRRHQAPLRSLAAFEKSEYADDWRELMRLYLVRRTRGFIKENYAKTDPATGRKFLTFEDGSKSYFPDRVPRTLKIALGTGSSSNQYARLFSPEVVDTINHLALPRYGLGNYVHASPHKPPTPNEAKHIQDLSRAGKRLMGFCRTNLFKRLESSGVAFLQSIERHILRNYVYLHAISTGLAMPLGTQGAEMLDGRIEDEDDNLTFGGLDDDDDNEDNAPGTSSNLRTEQDFKRRAAEIYQEYESRYKKYFKWIRPDLFVPSLEKDLRNDAADLIGLISKFGTWDPGLDPKLQELLRLLTLSHPTDKVLVFTQFADTVRYVEQQLAAAGIPDVAGATGHSENPTSLAWRFSPVSNNRHAQAERDGELRVLVATDVLSEGQNLQDCSIVVNFDLPWAIIRLIQRAGRVDRIGQVADRILCYSFLPADGVERIIRLRARVRQRLQENAEVVGADEAFFEDDRDDGAIVDLYHEKAGILDGEQDTEVDLASHAYQIWKNAIEADPTLEKTIQALPDVVFTSRNHHPKEAAPEGVLIYLKTSEGNDALAYVDKTGNSITESQFEILKAAACNPTTHAQTRHPEHHKIVESGIRHIVQEEKRVGGQLGRPSGARFRTYERLKLYIDDLQKTAPILVTDPLRKAIEEIYRFPLRQTAIDALNRQLKSGIDDEQLAEVVVTLREDDRLCLIEGEAEVQEPRIICSMGLFSAEG